MHGPPVYPERCRAYSWIRRPRLDDPHVEHTCFLVAEGLPTENRQAYRRPGTVVSGKCRGGGAPSSVSSNVCATLSKSSAALKAYVRVHKGVSLKEEDLLDLWHFMNLTDMCVTDIDFDDVFHTFHSREKKLRKSFLMTIVSTFVDLLEALMHLVTKINPTILLSLAIPLLAQFRNKFPKVADLLAPLLDHIEKLTHHQGKKTDKSQKKNLDDETSSNKPHAS